MFILIDPEKEAVANLRRKLYHACIHTMVISPAEIENIPPYLIIHAFLIPRPHHIENIEQICLSLRKSYPYLPLAIIFHPDGLNFYRYRRMVDMVFEEHARTIKMVDTLYALYEEKNHETTDIYRVGTLRTARKIPNRLTAVNTSFPATDAQYMLTRYLLLSHPRPVPATELLETCFLPRKKRHSRHIAKSLRELDDLFLKFFGIKMFRTKRNPISYYLDERIVDPSVKIL